MRKIKNTNAYSKIYNIRINIFQNILSQIINWDFIDLTSNKYLKRILDLRNNKSMFYTLIVGISKDEAKKGLEISIIQDDEIKKDIFSVKKEKTPESIEKFVEFIYNNIIFNDNYWDNFENEILVKWYLKKTFLTLNDIVYVLIVIQKKIFHY